MKLVIRATLEAEGMNAGGSRRLGPRPALHKNILLAEETEVVAR